MDFLSLFSGVGVTAGAVFAVRFWKAQKDKIPGAVQRVMTWFEKRTGWDIPDNAEARVVQHVRDGVVFADETFGSKLWWRTMIRLAMKDNGSGLIEKLETWAGTIDPLTVIEGMLPEDLRPLSNRAKEEIATRVATAPILAENPNADPEKIRASVAVVARSVIPASDTERPDLQAVLEATRARVAALRASMEKK